MIEKMLEEQKKLDDYIMDKHEISGPMLQERFTAMLVEIAECLNEWRRWKFWSNNREPRTNVEAHGLLTGELLREYNPLLEEYVDGLHFAISIATVVPFDPTAVFLPPETIERTYDEVLRQFNTVIFAVTNYQHMVFLMNWESIVSGYLLLGTSLGFSLAEIEEAFYKKHNVNYERQLNGY